MMGLGRLLVVGCAFALAGGLATAPFLMAAENPAHSARMLVPAAAIAVGTLTWALMVLPTKGSWMATVAGSITGLLAHPVMWALISIPVGFEMDAPAVQQASGAVLSGAFFGLLSALAYGVVTVPLAALVGWLLGRVPALRGSARVDRAAQSPR